MAKNNCQLKISYEDGLLTARLCGELDHHSAVAVRTLIDSEIKKHSPVKAVLDMKDLDFMDSSGIAVVVQTARKCQSCGGKLSVTHTPAQAQKVLTCAGIHRLVDIR